MVMRPGHWRLSAVSVAPPARMAKMQPSRVDLRGLSLDEAMAKVREQINAAQEEWLADYELAMTDIGGDAADHVAVERLRAEHVRLREAAIEKMRALVARGGKGLQ